MLKAAIALTIAAGLTACSVNPKPFTGPTGGQGYSMQCSGMGRDWEDCLTEAGRLCPQGYAIVHQGSSTSAVVGSAPASTGLMMVPVQKQTMAVECK
jgi:hypothetical protein